MLAKGVVALSQHAFYLARAQEARADADAATLDNVRDRCLRAEAAWTAMADRAERLARTRDKAIEAKAEALMLAQEVSA